MQLLIFLIIRKLDSTFLQVVYTATCQRNLKNKEKSHGIESGIRVKKVDKFAWEMHAIADSSDHRKERARP
jgi:hypothetical protein